MVSRRPTTNVLEQALRHFRGELTVADASAKSGLPLDSAQDALRTLAVECGGHLAATDKGELIYSFPNGLVRPKETRLLRRIATSVAKLAMGGIRLLVRAWVSVVLVGYALVFLVILLGLALRGGDDRDGDVGSGLGTVLRIIAEAFFWTFHPFSVMSIGREPLWMHQQARRNKLPFYERVNRFVFGPRKVLPDPREQERTIVGEIRRQKGRVAPSDIVRVTGMSRQEAERLLLRLVVDYQGDITVSDDGAILYNFVELRTTTSDRAHPNVPPSPVWNHRVELAPLTGNSGGWNLLFVLINGFNLAASGVALAKGLTLERLTEVFSRMIARDPDLLLVPLPPIEGIPLVLGAIPFAFSVALFALPLVRLLYRPREGHRVARENGWRAVLRQVLATEVPGRRMEYTPEELGRAWATAAGRPATEIELRAAVLDLGGEVDLRAHGTLVYKFDVVSRELEALLTARAGATNEEAAPGKVVFASADEGHGIRDDDGGTRDAPDEGPPARLLEEPRQPLEFVDQLLEEARRRRR